MLGAMPPARRTPRARRTYDAGRVRTALLAQVRSVGAAAHRLTPEQRALPSGLPGWDVHHLLVHIAGQIDAVPRLLAEPPPTEAKPAVTLSAWATSTATIADRLDETTRKDAAETEDGAALIDAAAERLTPVLDEAAAPGRLLPLGFGPMASADFLVTRLVELVVHSDDLARATGAEVGVDRQALAAVVRVLADALAAKAPGGSVEVRIPPFAVVQCVEGPRHTRGTPPNVVETDPLGWVRLATGRTTWAEAVEAGTVSAGGERADLSAYLPVLG